MRSLRELMFLSRLTFSFITAVYLFPAFAHGFEITVPEVVTVSETTLFNYSWTSKDPRNNVAIALYDSRNGGVGTNGGAGFEDNKPLFLNENEGSSSIELAVKRTGQFYLQAYTTENDRNRKSNFRFLANSSTFNVVLPAPLTTVVVSTVLPTTTPTPSLDPGSQDQGAEEKNQERPVESNSLSGGAIAGIVIGTLVFLLLVVAGIFLYRRRRFRRRVDSFHRERMIVRGLPMSQMSFWTGEEKSFTIPVSMSFGQESGSSSPLSDASRLSPLRGAGYS